MVKAKFVQENKMFKIKTNATTLRKKTCVQNKKRVIWFDGNKR